MTGVKYINPNAKAVHPAQSPQTSAITNPTQTSRHVRNQMTRETAKRAPKFPDGHVVGTAKARVFGPKGKSDPLGHPILLDTGHFDNTEQSALQAIMSRAMKQHGITPNPKNWELEMHETIVQPPPHKPALVLHHFYHFVYLPEIALQKQKGIHGKVPNPFKTSWYLTRNHLKNEPIDQSLATKLWPVTTITETK